MKIRIEYSKDQSTQSDYKAGALTIHADDTEAAFYLGEIFGKMVKDDKEVVCSYGSNNVFVRVPLIEESGR